MFQNNRQKFSPDRKLKAYYKKVLEKSNTEAISEIYLTCKHYQDCLSLYTDTFHFSSPMVVVDISVLHTKAECYAQLLVCC